MVYLVVRMKGTVNVPRWANLTLESLHLDKKFRATIIPENEQSLGMLRKIKEWVSWSSVDDSFIREFIEKKGRISASRLVMATTATGTTDAMGDSSLSGGSKGDIGGNGSSKSQNVDLDKVASTISQNQLYLSKIPGIKPWFALSPPKGGFRKKSKRSYSQNGILGENKELISLVKRMM
jgi:large subunit ribosomal protein L30